MREIDESPHKDRNCHCAGNLGAKFFADLSLQPPEDGVHLDTDSQQPHLIKFGIIWSTTSAHAQTHICCHGSGVGINLPFFSPPHVLKCQYIGKHKSVISAQFSFSI